MSSIEFIVLNKLQGKEKIGVIDDYLKTMKPFEMSLKMGVNYNISLEEFRDFLKENVYEWSNEEKKKLKYSIDKLDSRLKALNIFTPNKIYIIKTSGKEEWNSAYTRNNMILLPQKKISNYSYEGLFELLCHEFFHIYSRFNKNNRIRLYDLLGFKFIENNVIPDDLKKLSLVNPDALQEVYIEVSYKNKMIKVSPLIIVKNKNVDGTKDILESIRIKLYVIDSGDIIDAEDINEYIEKISVNTNNIQHPEETLAENFTYLLTEKYDVPNNDFLEEMKRILMP